MATKLYRFTVASRFPFPCDMLRYDVCWPADSDSASAISASIRQEPPHERWEVTLYSEQPGGPTAARWQSFMWAVTSQGRV